MNITQTMTLDVKNFATYFLEDIPGYLVINNHNNGLFVFTNTLNFYKEIKFLENIKIDKSFKKRDGSELLLYCPENGVFIHFDAKNLSTKRIPLGAIANETITPIYYWDDADLIITSKTNFFKVSILDNVVTKMSETNDALYDGLFECWTKYRNESIISYFQNEHIIALLEKNNTIKIVFFDPRHHQQKEAIILFVNENETVIDVRYNNGTFLVIKDKQIVAFKSDTDNKATIDIETHYAFMSACFLETSGSKMVALCDNISDQKATQLRVYDIVF